MSKNLKVVSRTFPIRHEDESGVYYENEDGYRWQHCIDCDAEIEIDMPCPHCAGR